MPLENCVDTRVLGTEQSQGAHCSVFRIVLFHTIIASTGTQGMFSQLSIILELAYVFIVDQTGSCKAHDWVPEGYRLPLRCISCRDTSPDKDDDCHFQSMYILNRISNANVLARFLHPTG